MNQLFIDKLHESMTDKNKNLLEAVELLYRTCEQKAQLEGRLGRTLGTAALCGASFLAGGGADKIGKAYDDFKADAKQTAQDAHTTSLAANRSYEGLVLKKHGYKYVDKSEHPGLYSDSFKGMNLDSLDKQDYVQAGWYVSPDGRKYYSTITGEVYEMPEGQTFDDATQENRGKRLGNGPLATKDVKPDEMDQCAIGIYAQYGEDPNCEGGKYTLLAPDELSIRGAVK